MKTRLDAAVVAAAECPPGKKRLDIYCTHNRGLILEVRPSGGKTYHIRYTDQHGDTKQLKVARADQVTFDQARKAARQLIAEAALGHDPAAKKKERKAVPLYADLSAQHMADAKLHLKSYKLQRAMMRRHILPRWGKVRLTDIDSRAVAQWLADKRGEGLKPATVEKIRVLFGRSFELGQRWGVPGCERNPTKGVPRKPLNNGRSVYLTAEEAARLKAAADVSRNKQLRPIVDLLLLTGARVGELLRAEWRHVHLEGRRWLIPESKTGKARHVPLSQAAVDVIEAIPRPEKAVYLFPNPADPAKHLTTIKHAFQTARAAAGLPDVHVHDLRHSAASFMVNSGVDLFAVGKVLGHVSVQSTQRYSHLANDTLLAAVEAGAAKQAQPT